MKRRVCSAVVMTDWRLKPVQYRCYNDVMSVKHCVMLCSVLTYLKGWIWAFRFNSSIDVMLDRDLNLRIPGSCFDVVFAAWLLWLDNLTKQLVPVVMPMLQSSPQLTNNGWFGRVKLNTAYFESISGAVSWHRLDPALLMTEDLTRLCDRKDTCGGLVFLRIVEVHDCHACIACIDCHWLLPISKDETHQQQVKRHTANEV
jgi:hypothetical protein